MANVPNARMRDHRKVLGWLQIRNPRGNIASVTFSIDRLLAVVVAIPTSIPDPESLAAMSKVLLIGSQVLVYVAYFPQG